MTQSATGDAMFAAIALLYAAAVVTYALGYTSSRDGAAAAAVTSVWLSTWCFIYTPWWATAAAAAAVIYFTFVWHHARKHP